MTRSTATISAQQVQVFQEQGYLVLRDVLDVATVQRWRQQGLALLSQDSAPVEFEADVQYPGSPESREAPGGETVRRILNIVSRGAPWDALMTLPVLRDVMPRLLGGNAYLSGAHHNCLMTKQPEFSSVTAWHQDLRYWRFSRGQLITAWIPLGRENANNGGLWVVPGSHRMAFSPEAFGERKFFRQDRTENQELLAKQELVELNVGDILLFHCRLLHAAGRNNTDEPKLALVGTYHREDDIPESGTRSASQPSRSLAQPIS